MATPAQWLEGARLRTLPAAISPVLVGCATAMLVHSEISWLSALLALIVGLSLQIGCNYANDYSDGIRGTDADRVGPLRLVGSGVASPKSVKYAAFISFGVAAVAGLVLVALIGQWWLLLVGLASILAAWWYTGGSHPYGYLGLGEVFVFIFFGLVATCGTTYVLVETLTWTTVALSVAMGCFASAILVANNLRDIATDIEAGKHTLATRLGDSATRKFYFGLIIIAEVLLALVAVFNSCWLLLGLVSIVLTIKPIKLVLSNVVGKKLIYVLKFTGLAQFVAALGIFVGVLLTTH